MLFLLTLPKSDPKRDRKHRNKVVIFEKTPQGLLNNGPYPQLK
jgi:hypothetical protein